MCRASWKYIESLYRFSHDCNFDAYASCVSVRLLVCDGVQLMCILRHPPFKNVFPAESWVNETNSTYFLSSHHGFRQLYSNLCIYSNLLIWFFSSYIFYSSCSHRRWKANPEPIRSNGFRLMLESTRKHTGKQLCTSQYPASSDNIDNCWMSARLNALSSRACFKIEQHTDD